MEDQNKFEYYCSACNAPVGENDQTCPNCGADISNELINYDDEKTTVVKVFNNEIDAQIAKEHLFSEGIPSFISMDDLGGMRPHMQLTGGVRLYVFEKDALDAAKILDQYFSDEE